MSGPYNPLTGAIALIFEGRPPLHPERKLLIASATGDDNVKAGESFDGTVRVTIENGQTRCWFKGTETLNYSLKLIGKKRKRLWATY